jgi:hypothetical protein
MLASIMTKPDFAEVCFLIAFILFVIELVIILTKNSPRWPYPNLLVVAGLAFVALGWLAL